MKCPFKFGYYEFEGSQDCIGSECGMFKRCGANDALAAENDVSEASVNANAGNADTREKLEADANGYVVSWWQSDWVDSFAHANIMKRDIMRLLDRQAAITKAWQREWWGGVVAEVQAKVDELTEDYKASSNGLEILTLKNAELQTQVNNLNSENAKLSSDELHLRQALASAEYDNATLREKLGRMLDCSHEITRIGGDC